MNFYKHYIGDFQRDTGHLSLTERGAYLCLIHHYYATEKPLPNDLDALCRIAGAVTKIDRAAVKVATGFFERVESGLMHARIEAELEKAGEISNTNREIALAREAKRRAQKEARTEHEQSTNRAQSVPRIEHEQSTNQTPVNNKEPPIPPKGGNPVNRSQAVSLKTFLASCKESGEKAIPEDDPVFDFSDKAGIPDEWLRLAWLEFMSRYGDGSKRYRDWRKAFRNAVRGNWFKIWYCGDDGKMLLTSQGRVLEMAHLEAA